MSIFVFLGPSLPRVAAERLLPATFLPPAQQGDILRVLERKPTAIGIVDGYFGVVPSIWHKEILLALEAQVPVFGAASMGALRAAELHPFGMVGVGTIFEWYRDGQIEGDDEVAIYHAPADLGYRSLTDALVNIRDACENAVRDGVISVGVAEELVATAKALRFSDRTYRKVAETLGAERAEVGNWLRYSIQREPDLKSRDTIALLQCMAKRRDVEPTPTCCAPIKVERTVFFERLRNAVRMGTLCESRSADDADGHRDLWQEHLAGGPRTAILIRMLAREACERLGWQIDSVEVSEYAGRFCAERGLSDANDRARWMAAMSISDEMFWRFINDSMLVAKLDRLFADEIDAALADHLRMSAVYEREG